MASRSRHGAPSSRPTSSSFGGPRRGSYEPPRDNPNPSLLLQEPNSHVSRGGRLATATIKNGGGRCHLAEVIKCCTPKSGIRALLEPTGFVDFLAVNTPDHTNMIVLKALAERWWDTTNTFHFACGEMTCTPLDLHMISGIRFGIRPLDMCNDWRATFSVEEIQNLIGFDPPKDSMNVRCTFLHERLEWLTMSNFASDEVVARLCLLVIMGCTFTQTMRDTVDLNVLSSLVHTDAWDQYDWGGAILSTMYREMIDLSRECVLSVGGTTLFWEVADIRFFGWSEMGRINLWHPSQALPAEYSGFLRPAGWSSDCPPLRREDVVCSSCGLCRGSFLQELFNGVEAYLYQCPNLNYLEFCNRFLMREVTWQGRPSTALTIPREPIPPTAPKASSDGSFGEHIPEFDHGAGPSHNTGGINWDTEYQLPEVIGYYSADGAMRSWRLPDTVHPGERMIPDDVAQVPGDYARRNYRISRRMEVALGGLLTRLDMGDSQDAEDKDVRQRRRGDRF